MMMATCLDHLVNIDTDKNKFFSRSF